MYANLSEALLDNLPVPVLAVDDFGHILEINEAARRLLPATTTATTGERFDTLFPQWSVLLTLMKSHTEGFQQEIHWGESSVGEARVTPIPAYGWAVMVLDVSALKEQETARNNLLGEIMHDLKQPISAISSFVDLVKAGGELSDRQTQFLDRIRNTASRMAEQVHQMLDVAWIDSGMNITLAEVDLVGTAKNVLEDLEPRAEARSISLLLDAPSPVPPIMADANRMTQVIANLLTNAIKYSGENTIVTVRISAQPDAVILSVSDQGIGIAEEHLPNVFQRFFRVQDKQTRRIEGSGLGLYISRSIVEKHGGRITVQSEPGKGSTFTVSLPLKQSDSQG